MVGVDEFRLLWETGAGDAAFIALFDKGPMDFDASRAQSSSTRRNALPVEGRREDPAQGERAAVPMITSQLQPSG